MLSATLAASLRAELVEQPVEQQQFRLVHGGRGQPGPAGDHRGRGPERHVGPRGQRQPVQDRGGQHLTVPAGQLGQPGRVPDQAAHPAHRLRPGGPRAMPT